MLSSSTPRLFIKQGGVIPVLKALSGGTAALPLPTSPMQTAGSKPLHMGLPPSACTPAATGTHRSPHCPLPMGQVGVIPVPKALSGGTAALSLPVRQGNVPNANRKQHATAHGLATICPHTCCNRDAPQPALYSCGRWASTRSRKHCPAALPPEPPPRLCLQGRATSPTQTAGGNPLHVGLPLSACTPSATGTHRT